MTFAIACAGGACFDTGALGAMGVLGGLGVVGFWLFGKLSMWRSSRRMARIAEEVGS